MKKFLFPALKDREHIHNTINHFTHGKCNRIDMMRIIGNILKDYGVTKMSVFDYNVKILQNTKVKINGEFVDIPVILIEGTKFSDNCPVCKSSSNDASYLSTVEENAGRGYDIVNATCLECGCVYATNGNNLEQYQIDMQ